jgi:predicted PurR-regulated permease PerM
LGPILTKQVKRFIESIPNFAKEVENTVNKLLDSEMARNLHMEEKINIDKMVTNILGQVDDIFLYISNNVVGVLSTVTGAAMIAIIIPFVLFYLLKDGESFSQLIVKWFPIKHQEEVKKILSQMNFTLSSYIQGQIIVSLIVGLLIYVGYLVIGLDYSLFLALIATVANIIPFLGPVIGLVFALVVGMMHSLKMTILVTVVVLSVQAIDSNYISPKILGQKLDIHPLTIIFILLFAGNFAGLLGMLIGVPIYALSKVIITNIYRLWKLKLKTSERQKKKNPFMD